MVRRDWFLHYGEWALLARRGAAVDAGVTAFSPLHRMSKVGKCLGGNPIMAEREGAGFAERSAPASFSLVLFWLIVARGPAPPGETDMGSSDHGH